MKYEFSKLEIWWKDVVLNWEGNIVDVIGQLKGYSVIKIYERKWYNPLRYILAKNGIYKVPQDKFYDTTYETKEAKEEQSPEVKRGLDEEAR